MNDNQFLLWLTIKQGISNKLIRKLLDVYETPQGIYNETKYDDIKLTPKQHGLLSDKSMSGVSKVLNELKALNARVITIYDTEYPNQLKSISDPPFVLYAMGQSPRWTKQPVIGVVGTRKYSSYGKDITKKITMELLDGGAVIVSGLARGIDTFAHQCTIDRGGITVAVVGCGLDTVYPAENFGLFRKITERGLVLSEYPPGTPPNPYHFPQRNRIVAGLCHGILVTEAPLKSGAIITANQAIEYNRRVFAVPGNIYDINSRGCNRLISEGAVLVEHGNDIISIFKKIRKKSETKPAPVAMGDAESLTYKIIGLLSESTMTADEISMIIGVSANEVLSELTLLEIEGIVIGLSDDKYSMAN